MWLILIFCAVFDNEFLLMYISASASDTEASTGPVDLVHSHFPLCVSSVVEQHDLVYISCWHAVQVSWHLHHCVVDYSDCLHNCASCAWSFSWYPQTLHEDTSQDLWGELNVYLMHNIIRRVHNFSIIYKCCWWTEKVGLFIDYTLYNILKQTYYL